MEELARLFLILLVIALVVRLAKDGPAGVTAWMRAKFLGQAPPTAEKAAAKRLAVTRATQSQSAGGVGGVLGSLESAASTGWQISNAPAVAGQKLGGLILGQHLPSPNPFDYLP